MPKSLIGTESPEQNIANVTIKIHPWKKNEELNA